MTKTREGLVDWKIGEEEQRDCRWRISGVEFPRKQPAYPNKSTVKPQPPIRPLPFAGCSFML